MGKVFILRAEFPSEMLLENHNDTNIAYLTTKKNNYNELAAF
jgi:hypothetical protein